jgi:hypothetical protein
MGITLMLLVPVLVVAVLLVLERKVECVGGSLDFNVMKVFHAVWKGISLMLLVLVFGVTVLFELQRKVKCVRGLLQFNVKKI